jgi:hypothetical protein
MATEKVERVVVLFSKDELASLETAMKVAAKEKGVRNPKTSAFLRDHLLNWADDTLAKSAPLFGEMKVPA